MEREDIEKDGVIAKDLTSLPGSFRKRSMDSRRNREDFTFERRREPVVGRI